MEVSLIDRCRVTDEVEFIRAIEAFGLHPSSLPVVGIGHHTTALRERTWCPGAFGSPAVF